MSGIELAGFLALAAMAAYIQTLTGFAFGLIMMGGVGLLGPGLSDWATGRELLADPSRWVSAPWMSPPRVMRLTSRSRTARAAGSSQTGGSPRRRPT